MSMRVPLVTVMLVIGNGCLAGALGLRLFDGSQRDALAASDGATAEWQFPTVEAPSVTPLDEIQSRAIFHQSRSFYVAPPVREVVLPPPDYRLAGAMSIPGKQSAVMVHLQTGARVRVGTGEQLDGWTVAAIGPRSVTIQLGDRTAEITATGKPSHGVTLATTPPAVVDSAASSGVRVLGNAAGHAKRPLPVVNGYSNQPPRIYRPPAR